MKITIEKNGKVATAEMADSIIDSLQKLNGLDESDVVEAIADSILQDKEYKQLLQEGSP